MSSPNKRVLLGSDSSWNSRNSEKGKKKKEMKMEQRDFKVQQNDL